MDGGIYAGESTMQNARQKYCILALAFHTHRPRKKNNDKLWGRACNLYTYVFGSTDISPEPQQLAILLSMDEEHKLQIPIFLGKTCVRSVATQWGNPSPMAVQRPSNNLQGSDWAGKHASQSRRPQEDNHAESEIL